MSEALKNREYRQAVLKDLIRQLHQGRKPDEVKEQFHALVSDIGGAELAQLEQDLIDEGLPEQEIRRLCDVHVAVFRDALDEAPQAHAAPGHPIHTFKSENRAIERVLSEISTLIEGITAEPPGAVISTQIAQWKDLHSKLSRVEVHYIRKENLLFPYLEKYGISGPPSVMWSIHDEIRNGLKSVARLLDESPSPASPQWSAHIADDVVPLLNSVREMIFKEEHILFPMCLETLTADEWSRIASETGELGYCLIDPPPGFAPYSDQPRQKAEGSLPGGLLQFDTGAMSLVEISRIFDFLPVDITYVDKDDVVRYFSGRERIFPRTRAIIGRKVQNCHPPASVHVVSQIVDDFKNGRRNIAEFWLTIQGRFIHIRYFALRDEGGRYQGTLEVTQDVTDIRNLQGEKRLLEGNLNPDPGRAMSAGTGTVQLQ